MDSSFCFFILPSVVFGQWNGVDYLEETASPARSPQLDISVPTRSRLAWMAGRALVC